MLTLHPAAKDIGDSWSRACDTCGSDASVVYCRAHLAYLCAVCDARLHAATASRHERVWLCSACERAPAAFVCKADAASLCDACDADIHSANPLSRRHHRVPITPIPGALRAGPNPSEELLIGRSGNSHDESFLTVDGNNEEEDETASWLVFNTGKSEGEEDKGVFGGEVDEYFDLEEYNSFQNENNEFNYVYAKQAQQQQQQQYVVGDQRNYGGDSVVPIEIEKGKNNQWDQLGLESYSEASMSQSVSLSSMEVGVVPESAITEISVISHSRPPKGTIDLFSGPPLQIPAQLSPMDREARVLRYREKKKNRKFEKTIRYASRKAYAETRPRIKGRFAKRTQVELEVDQMFSSSMNAYGVVPSF